MSTRLATTRLGVERLEERDVPAITVLVDYSLDARANGGAGFFQDHPDAKAVMNRVAYEMGQRITADFTAITPGGGNSWSALFYDPRTGGQFAVANRAIAADTIVVYAGARAMPGQPGRGRRLWRLLVFGRRRRGATPSPAAAGRASHSGAAASPSTPP